MCSFVLLTLAFVSLWSVIALMSQLFAFRRQWERAAAQYAKAENPDGEKIQKT